MYTPCFVYTLSFFPANLEGQWCRHLNEAEVKEEIQELIGGGSGRDTYLEFLRRILRTSISLNDEVKRLRQLFLEIYSEKL